MNIAFIGVGYVGLVSGVMMSSLGHNVVCCDIDTNKITQLKKGILPIYEPELEKYLNISAASGTLEFTNSYDDISRAKIIFITVGTPSLPSGDANVSYVHAAINDIKNIVQPDTVIVIKSTVPPGTCEKIEDKLKIENFKLQIVSNPEFLREGCAVEDFLNPDRIVIGISDDNSRNILEEVYRPFLSREIPFVWSNSVTAELIKYSSNSFLATKIAFINEMANICETIGADIEKLSMGMGLDNRIGKDFLKAGPGFGGSCFPKDILALSQTAKKNNVDCLVLDAVIRANSNRPEDMVKKICKILGNDLSNNVLAVLGLSFKAGTDDIRHSPAIEIIQLLVNKDVTIKVYDPICLNSKEQIAKVNYTNSAMEAITGTDAVIILTEWSEFKDLDFDIIYKIMKKPIIIDLRNILVATEIKQKGFKYYSVGRKDE